MIKADLLSAIGALAADELVLFQLPDGTVLAPASIEVQQEEPPIHAIVVMEKVTKAALQRIKDERQAARDEAARIEAERVAETQAREQREQVAREAAAMAEATRFSEAVAAEVAKIDAAKQAKT